MWPLLQQNLCSILFKRHISSRNFIRMNVLLSFFLFLRGRNLLEMKINIIYTIKKERDDGAIVCRI